MTRTPGRHRKPIITILCAVLAVALVCSAVYLFAFRTLVIVSDRAFHQVLPQATVRRLRLSMATRGIRLKVENLEDECFDDPDIFQTRIRNLKGDWIMLGPLSSAYSVSNNIDVSGLFEKTVVIAMHSRTDTRLFDCTLVSDERTGWLLAAEKLESEFAKTARNTALIYESGSIDYVQDIRSRFGAGRLSVFEDISGSGLFVSETKKAMEESAIVVAMCPYDSRLYEFFRTTDTLYWVVDYRFAPAVPSGRLYGIVVPDFDSSLKTAMGTEKGSFGSVTLEYSYEKL